MNQKTLIIIVIIAAVYFIFIKKPYASDYPPSSQPINPSTGLPYINPLTGLPPMQIQQNLPQTPWYGFIGEWLSGLANLWGAIKGSGRTSPPGGTFGPTTGQIGWPPRSGGF